MAPVNYIVGNGINLRFANDSIGRGTITKISLDEGSIELNHVPYSLTELDQGYHIEGQNLVDIKRGSNL